MSSASSEVSLEINVDRNWPSSIIIRVTMCKIELAVYTWICKCQCCLVASYVCITTWFSFLPKCTYKLVMKWILKLAKREREYVMDNQQSISDVAKLQAIGLVAITISEAVLPKGRNVKFIAHELDDANLLSYHGLPLKHILECQKVVCKTISTLETK